MWKEKAEFLDEERDEFFRNIMESQKDLNTKLNNLKKRFYFIK